MTAALIRRNLGLVFLVVFASLAVIVAAIILAPQPTKPYSPQEVSRLVDKLNYNAAVGTPHFSLGTSIRNSHLDLFEKVEKGLPLVDKESAEYRVLYQTILRENRWYLRLFDWHLTVLIDYGMDRRNNIGGQGIGGRHDHHDESALRNFKSVENALANIAHADGIGASGRRILNAASAYKDLTDIILHMGTAPQTVSVMYSSREPVTPLEKLYESVIFHYKAAQFDPVNSPRYVAEVHAALNSYDVLVLAVQTEINSHLSPWEQAVAGGWLSWRSLGPGLKDKSSGPLARSKTP